VQSYRLKIKIILALAIFIATGMLLMDMVISMTGHKRLVLAEVEKAEVVAQVMARRLEAAPAMSDGLHAEVAGQAWGLGMELLVVDGRGAVRFPAPDQLGAGPAMIKAAQEAVATGRMAKGTAGPRFGPLGRRYETLQVAVPLKNEDGLLSGALVLSVNLAGLHEQFWADQRLFALYILFNLAILTFVAYQRLAKLLIKPLQRLASRAEEYQDDESFYFLTDRRGDEVAALSASLNRMLRRINTDRHKLQEMVAALEEANLSLKTAQQEVIRAEKLASVGRLSAGIAHEIGNPVGIVLGYLELLQQEDLQPGQRLDFIQRATHEINRISTIIRQLLDLSRSDEEEQGEVHIHDLLGDLCAGLQEQPLLAGLSVTLKTAAADDRVYGVADRLRQVFLNIIMNAADAVRDNGPERPGRLTISTALVEQAGKRQGRPALQIRFADNGPGISPANVETVFDPFFTTKEPGKGTGLGLSVSYMIIENVGGKISVASRPGQGSVFSVILPLSRAAEKQEKQSRP